MIRRMIVILLILPAFTALYECSDGNNEVKTGTAVIVPVNRAGMDDDSRNKKKLNEYAQSIAASRSSDDHKAERFLSFYEKTMKVRLKDPEDVRALLRDYRSILKIDPEGLSFISNMEAILPGAVTLPVFDYSVFQARNPVEPRLSKTHTSRITALDVSYDNRFILSGSADNTIRIWSMDGVLLRSIERLKKEVDEIRVCRDGRHFVSSDYEGLISVWEMDGRLVKQFTPALPGEFSYDRDKQLPAKMRNLRMTPDGRAVIGHTRNEIIMAGTNGNVIRYLRYPINDRTVINTLDLSDDGTQIAIGGYYTDSGFQRGFVRLFDTNLKLVRELENGRARSLTESVDSAVNYVYWLAFTPGGGKVAALDNRRHIKVWDRNGALLNTLDNLHVISLTDEDNACRYYQISPDGRCLITARSDLITVQELLTQRKQVMKDMSDDFRAYSEVRGVVTYNGYITISALSRDGRHIITGVSGDGSLFQVDRRGNITGAVFSVIGQVKDLDFSRDSLHMLAGSDLTVLENGKKNERYHTFDFNLAAGHSGLFEGAGAYSPDGRTFVKLENVRQERTFTNSDGLISYRTPDRQLVLRIENGAGRHVFSITNQRYMANVENSRIVFEPGSRYFGVFEKGLPARMKIYETNGNLFKDYKDSLGGKQVALTDNGLLFFDARLWDIFGNPMDNAGGFRAGETASFSRDSGFYLAFRDNMAPEVRTIEGVVTGRLQISSDNRFFHEEKYRISPTGKYAAVSLRDGTVLVYDRNGKLLRKFSSHNRVLKDLVFSSDERFIVSASEDRTVRLCSIEGDKVLTLAVLNSGGWFVYDQDGRFNCTADARNYVNFVKGLEYYRPEQFWDRFFTPGLLGYYFGAGKEVSEKGPEINDAFIARAPDVSIMYPSDGMVTTEPVIQVELFIKPGNNGVGRKLIYLNGRVIDLASRGIEVKAKPGGPVYSLNLTEGENTIIGAAFDKDNTVEGRSAKVKVIYRPRTAVKPDLYILAVGVSQYQDANIRLKSPAKDARDVISLFRGLAGPLYGRVNTVLLTDGQANAENIRKNFAELASKAKPEDAVIIFFAGHGITDAGKYYFLTVETDLTRLPETSLSIGDLEAFLDRLTAGKVALFLDTCQSGSAVKDIGRIALSRSIDDRRMYASLARARGIAVISASSPTEAAFEIKALDNGILTWSMMKAGDEYRSLFVSGGAALSVSRFLEAVNRITRQTSAQYLDMEQSPVMYVFGDDFPLGRP